MLPGAFLIPDERKLQFIALFSAEGAYLLPGRRWVKICPKGYFEPDVEFGWDGMLHRKVQTF